MEGDSLNYSEGAKGVISIKRSGYFFIYVQMQPNGMTSVNPAVKWYFSVRRRRGGATDGVPETLLLVKQERVMVKQNGGGGMVEDVSTNSTMVGVVVKKLVQGDTLDVVVNRGTVWWASIATQTFGVFAL